MGKQAIPAPQRQGSTELHEKKKPYKPSSMGLVGKTNQSVWATLVTTNPGKHRSIAEKIVSLVFFYVWAYIAFFLTKNFFRRK